MNVLVQNFIKSNDTYFSFSVCICLCHYHHYCLILKSLFVYLFFNLQMVSGNVFNRFGSGEFQRFVNDGGQGGSGVCGMGLYVLLVTLSNCCRHVYFITFFLFSILFWHLYQLRVSNTHIHTYVAESKVGKRKSEKKFFSHFLTLCRRFFLVCQKLFVEKTERKFKKQPCYII